MEGLITRYRPKTLSGVWGNDSIKERWEGYVGRKDFPHSIILVGGFGQGKTTLAPIFCEDIMRFVVTNRKGIFVPNLYRRDPSDYDYRSMRDFIINIRYSMGSPFVMFLDEAQRMSEKRIQELFLRPIEEYSSLYCVFATTDIEAMNPALVRRSTIFVVEPPPLEILEVELSGIAQKEQIPISAEVLVYLIEQADRVPRDCLKYLELLYGCKEPITIEVVRSRISANVGAKYAKEQ